MDPRPNKDHHRPDFNDSGFLVTDGDSIMARGIKRGDPLEWPCVTRRSPFFILAAVSDGLDGYVAPPVTVNAARLECISTPIGG